MGTGSGCIALALANELKNAEVYAVDLSADALEIARANAARLQLDGRVKFLQSNVLDSARRAFTTSISWSAIRLTSGRTKPTRCSDRCSSSSRRMAVFSGESGLDVIRPLIEQAHAALKPGGWLAMEIGYSMRDMVLELLSPTMWDDVRVVPDLQGIPRVMAAQRKPHATRERLAL